MSAAGEPPAPRAPGRGAAGPWMALALGLALALGASWAGFALLWPRAGRPAANDAELLANEELRHAVIARLAQAAQAQNDSHPDAAVARTLIPSLERSEGPIVVRTSVQGLRERDYVLPKPPGLVRVVLVGDSFVYGEGVQAEERLGARLERFLAERKGPGTPAVEVLHLAVPSWNLASEEAYLRRQLDRLLPDLVVQVTFSNDLNDIAGARGYGALASFSPPHPGRADSLIGAVWQRVRTFRGPLALTGDEVRSLLLNYGYSGLLLTGLGRESRTRLRAARASVLRVSQALAALPGSPPYLLVVHWGDFTGVLRAELGPELDERVLYVPVEFSRDSSTWVQSADNHWNPGGHETMARVLYGTLRARGWLGSLALAPWPEAEEEARSFAARGLAFARQPSAEVARAKERLFPALDLSALDRGTALQIHGGVDEERLVSPYASLLLGAKPDARTLRVSGRALPDGVLRGALVRVFVEEAEVGRIELEPDAPIELAVPLPAGLDPDAPLNVRFESDDFVYRGSDLRHCVVFELARVALE